MICCDWEDEKYERILKIIIIIIQYVKKSTIFDMNSRDMAKQTWTFWVLNKEPKK